MAGNIVTPDIAEHLIQNCGVDVVKVGIGPGAQCETRIMTGVGYPQLSAVIETANFAHGVHGHVISDGGCKTPGDVAKAFAGGADFVMLGTMLGGHDENESEIIEKDGQMFVKIYGMSSSEAMNKHYGGVEKHRASEGKTSLIPYKGSIEGTIQQILGGVRSAATYIGAANIKEMHKRATFVRLK
jgi:GMP reductase